MAQRSTLASCLLLCIVAACVHAKVYTKCELAQSLKNNGVPKSQIATWVCIADAESSLNTARTNHNSNGSNDYGIFQINDKYWCSPPGQGKGCSLACSRLLDSDVADDVRCALKIHREWQARSTKDGFLAWSSYKVHGKCRTAAQTAPFVRGCAL